MSDLPEFYFRLRDNGATVFRLEGEGRERRLDMTQIASVNIRSGEIKPRGDRALSAEEQAAIATWVQDRQALQGARAIDDVDRLMEALNQTAHWAQTRADAAALEAVTEPLLLAMHDLRTVLLRRKSQRLAARLPAVGDD